MFVCSVSRSVDNIVSLYNCVVLLVDYFVAVNRCWYVTLTRYFVSSLTSTFSHVLLRSQPLVHYRRVLHESNYVCQSVELDGFTSRDGGINRGTCCH